MPLLEDAVLVSNKPVGPRLFIAEIESEIIAREVKPGQFAHLQLPGKEDSVLRRPFSVYGAYPEEGRIEILYQTVGKGTRYLSEIKPNSDDAIRVSILGPLGNTWLSSSAAPEKLDNVLLVGGGVGAAPLYLLAKSLVDAGKHVDVVLGAQTADMLVTRRRYTRLFDGIEPDCATDDGTYGFSGFATPLVEKRLKDSSRNEGAPYDLVCVCGPEPFMRIVVGMAFENDVPCEVSLEKRMACGIGACLSCVVKTKEGNKRSCVDGPIFDAREVVW